MKSVKAMKKVKVATLILSLLMIMGINTTYASSYETLSISASSITPDGGSKYGKDSATCVKNLSLYREYYKQWRVSKYKDDAIAESMVEPWSWCFNNCPSVSKNMYAHGIRIVQWEIKKAKAEGDTARQNLLVDTLLNIYTQQMATFVNDPKNPDGKLIGKQAQLLAKYRKNDIKGYYQLFDTSVTLMGTKSDPSILKGYFWATEKYVSKKYAPRDLVFDNYIKIMDIIEYNYNNCDTTSLTNPKELKKAKRQCSNFNVVEAYLEKRIENYATCDKLVKYYTPKQEESPNDIELAKKIVKFFEMRKCTDSDIYYKALGKVHAESPSAESALSMGNMAMKRKEFAKAKPYLIQATELFSDSVANKKGAAYLLLAEDLRNLKQYSAARTAALNSLKYKPNEGMAYVIIGDMYVSSAKDCQESGINIAYWAAADKYQKAINISADDKVKKIARQRLANIAKSYPIKTDLFMRNWTVGQSMQVGCWINETTTVRARK
jgi:tetratricopeptide (TPR) repeat protein